MTSRDFVFWLQGYFEITGHGVHESLTARSVQEIKKHLAMVFAHEIDPSFGGPEEQPKLDAINPQNPNLDPGRPRVRPFDPKSTLIC